MTAIRKDIIFRSDDKDVRLVDQKIKNPWRWEWMEKEVDGTHLGNVFRKIDKPGCGYCIICAKEISYGSRGMSALFSHMRHASHKAIAEARNGII